MNPLAACARRRQAIRLSDDESDDEGHRSSCLPWCFKTQPIALQDDTPGSRILDDYLDPNTTVGIEPLLAQHPPQDNEFANNAIFSSEPQRFLSRNPFATTAERTDYFIEDNDAQFLSDHRISAVISDRVKINDASCSNPVTRIKPEEEEEREKRTSRTAEDYGRELFAAPKLERELQDFSIPKVSTDDDFADRELEDFNTYEDGRELEDISVRKEPDRELEDINTELVDFSDARPAQELKDISYPPAERELQGFNKSVKVKGYDISAERELVDFNPPAERELQAIVPPSTPEKVQDFVSRELVDIPAIQSISQPPSPKPNVRDVKDTDEVSEAGSSGRRSSVAVVAQSLLGDRLEDFTEKLAYIKKNIIMSLEDEDNSDDEQQQQQQQQPKRRTSYDPLMSASIDKSRPQHKRSSSLMEAAGKFMHQLNQAALENGNNNDNNADHRVFSPSSFFATLAGPEAQDHQDSDHHQRDIRHHHERPSNWPDAVPEEEEERDEEDEEDLFDFSKMLEMGKNVRHMGEDMVGNGLRMFNDMANRVKTANTNKPGSSEDNDNWMLDRDAWM